MAKCSSYLFFFIDFMLSGGMDITVDSKLGMNVNLGKIFENKPNIILKYAVLYKYFTICKHV